MTKPWHPEPHAHQVQPTRQDLGLFICGGRAESQGFGSKPILGVALEGIPDPVPCRWHGGSQVTLRASQLTGLVACSRAEGTEVKDHHDPGLCRGLAWIGDAPSEQVPNNGFDIKGNRNTALVRAPEVAQ